MRSAHPRLISDLAEHFVHQRGVICRRQVLDRGGHDGFIRTQLRSGRWRKVGPGVYVLVGTPPSWEQDLWVSVLAVGHDAVVSHESAGAMHDLSGFARHGQVVTVAHSGWVRVPGTVAHQISDSTADWHMRIDGLPVTTVARTFVDLAAVSRRLRIRNALDDARAANKVTIEQVGAALAAVARKGKPGVHLLGSVLDELGPGVTMASTALERRLHAVVEHAGLPSLILQYRFPGRQLVQGCVDGAWPDMKLIVEADSRRWHTRIQDLSRDHLRDQEAARAGWQTLRVMYEHLVSDPVGTADMLAATRAARLRQAA